MEKITIILKKSANVHAWNNSFVGQEVLAKVSRDEKWYIVDFSENTHINVAPHYLTGGVPFEDADVKQLPKETTLGQLFRGDYFMFGGVKFMRSQDFADDNDNLVQCKIADVEAWVYISTMAWVSLINK